MEADAVRPVSSQKIQLHYSPSVLRKKTGVVAKDLRFKWQTPDTVKPFEQGLPLITDSPLSKPFVDPVEVETSMKARKEDLLNLLYPEEVRELLRQNNAYEEQTNVSKDNKFTGLYNRLNKKKLRMKNKPITGLMRVPIQEDVIDCIGTINLKSVSGREPLKEGESAFPAIPRKLPRENAPKKELSNVVKEQIHRVFKSNTEPFTSIDNEADFPLEGFYPPSHASEVIEDSECEVEEEEEQNEKTLLIDPHERDIYFTKEKVPFTRNEVWMFNKWRKDNKENRYLCRQKDDQILHERAQSIERTFQSRLAFDKELDITDKLCDRVKYLPVGKGENRKKLSWQKAALAAKKDRSALPYRKAIWTELRNQVKESGYLQTPEQETLVLEFRRLLISGVVVDTNCFFRALDVLKGMDFAKLSTAVIIEYLRRDIGVPQEILLKYLEKRGAPDYFILEAPGEIERIIRKKQRAERRLKEEQHLRNLRAGNITVPDLKLGMPIFGRT